MISIIIPTYNSENKITRCLESIYAQNYDNFEVIIIDDNSSDKTIEIASTYLTKISRLKFVKNEQNRGAGFSRNVGIDHAIGDILFFIDSDDYLFDINALSLINKTFVVSNPDLLLFKHNRFDIDNNVFTSPVSNREVEFWLSHNIEKQITLQDCPEILLFPAYPWNKAVSRKMVIDNNLRFSETTCHNDLTFSWISMLTAKSLYILPNELLTHCYSDDSGRISNIKSEKRFDLFTVLEEVSSYLYKSEQFDLLPYFVQFSLDSFTWGKSKVNAMYLKNFTFRYSQFLRRFSRKVIREHKNRFQKTLYQKIKFILISKIPELFVFLYKRKI